MGIREASPRAVYEIARYGTGTAAATVLERVELLSVDGELRLRNADGSETPSAGGDIEAVISSTPSLREIRAGEDIEAAPDGADASECYVEANRESDPDLHPPCSGDPLQS